MVSCYRAKLGIVVAAVCCCFIVYLTRAKTDSASLPATSEDSSHATPEKLKAVGVGVEDSSNNDPIPLKTLRKDGISYNLGSHDIAKMSPSQRLSTVHSILDNTDTVCKRKLRMGNIDDGGWEVCDDIDVRPHRPCLVYSFGINGDFSFDDDMAQTYGCHVHSFDHTMNEKSHNRSDLVHFHKIGISGLTVGSVYTFSDIRKMLGHENMDIDIVKMDVESCEWWVIPNMVATGEMKKFKQFSVEFHLWNGTGEDILDVVKSIETEGFRKFYTHKNPGCDIKIQNVPGRRSTCYEVHYVRRPHEKLD